ncbi:MAG TPA: septation protein SepH [Pseudonocardia sp.]|jgi:hypothetical protein
MRALRVVGYDEEGSGQPVVILEDPDRRERFTVPADERLRAAARGDVQRLGQMSMELESQLRPREIQARIRAGASVEQVAAAAGVPHQRIERFAYPVLLERSRFAELARSAHPLRDDGPDVRTLEEVVVQTFALRGQEYEPAEWDAWRGEDNKWVVTLSWKVGRSDITAHWGYHPGSHGGTVSALDEQAVDLIDGQLNRPPRRVGPVVDFGKPDSAGLDAGLGAGLDAGTDAAGPAAPTLAPSSAESDRATGTERASAPRPVGRNPDAGRRATKTTTGPNAGTVRPDNDPSGEPGTAKRASRKAKPVMPSWEDVLLGVKSPRE